MDKAVIFDMDGTLFDTERIYRSSWLETGVPVELYQRFIGRSAESISGMLKDAGFDPEETVARKKALVVKKLEKGIPVKPGAAEAVDGLHRAGIITAIATSTAMETAVSYLERTGFAGRFDRVISGNRLPNGKPAPDIFLMTAKELGVSPEHCVVVEDSENGVRAGHAAGMLTLMVPDMVPPDEELRSLCGGVLDSLSGLIPWLTSAGWL